MKNIIRKIVVKVYNFLPYKLAIKIRYIIELCLWKCWISNAPWHTLKQKNIEELQKKTWIKVFVETWTYKWDMLIAQKNNFDLLYSIELSEFYYKRAVELLKEYKHIKLILWDSWEKYEKY